MIARAFHMHFAECNEILLALENIYVVKFGRAEVMETYCEQEAALRPIVPFITPSIQPRHFFTRTSSVSKISILYSVGNEFEIFK
jgi:hypothetical protein